jgi:hypothetical protein
LKSLIDDVLDRLLLVHIIDITSFSLTRCISFVSVCREDSIYSSDNDFDIVFNLADAVGIITVHL